MNYLRYSSDEMFSSTELIRKSKIIFDKLNKREIEKAVILRDGKPSFMLLDFATYERLMKEYEKLNYKAGKKTQEQFLSLDDIEVSNNTKNVKAINPISEPITEIEDIKEIKEIDEIDEIELPVQESKIEDITQIEQISSDEINDEDLLKALEEIDRINISNDTPSDTSINDEIDDFENDFDDDFKVALDEIKDEEEKVKEPPLKEFWDN